MQDPVVEPVETTICNRLRVYRLRLFAEAYSSVSLDFDTLNRRLDDNFKNSNFDLTENFISNSRLISTGSRYGLELFNSAKKNHPYINCRNDLQKEKFTVRKKFYCL